MELLGLGVEFLVLFVSFGFMVGVFFGFFGMGGSFLVTPALLILGYPAPVAIGSSMAFVFGTAVIATMKHHDVGQVDYKLGALMFVGIALGIEAGKYVVFFLEALGRAELVVGVAYVLLLAAIGLVFVRSALTQDEGSTGTDHADDEIPAIATKIKSYDVPPMVTLTDGSEASMWTISGVGGGVGLVSGFLGVGGGFIRMPAIYYLVGVPLAAAVGTSLFGALMSGAVGAFTYGLGGVIDLGIVTALLAGSALGARIGSAATAYIDENDVTIYFGVMLLLASTAVALGELATWLEIPTLDTISFVLLVGSSAFVTTMIFYYGAQAVRANGTSPAATVGGND
ncbi:sulfite exporter TauE/SafE family protein [Natrarchaeobius halalkaliphilus]|uniref:Probable membrane transporter protein n=1 Tax=Natrarchaeobius halalkaliphilus TaxID=1679091 RepID=A0A3N6P0H1_9EURY|nr:sulfite exporter TauE/SafE family protein [Natrarchaeobius halalkaliphilus]RQG87978.1 sulfite exporter TauE/SafE family protein [Natrarchaeobius halalkaliphilus]